uniref:Uncharacterized protein n=1 Tax=Anguilla anguilla TaxID=7936 RepID=A0A0E9WDR7_ANGAN
MTKLSKGRAMYVNISQHSSSHITLGGTTQTKIRILMKFIALPTKAPPTEPSI